MEEERSERAWGVELWDQSDQLLNFTSEQNSVTANYLNMLTDVQKMHTDIAKKYKKTVAAYMPKKGEEPDLIYPSTLIRYAQVFYDMGSVHEKLAESLNAKILTALKSLTDEQKQFVNSKTKKRAELIHTLDEKRKNLEKSWTVYSKAHKEKLGANEQNEKAKNDYTLPRTELAKFEDIYKTRTQECEQASMRYAQDMKNYNEYCTKFYTHKNMDFITEIEELNVTRHEKTKEILEQVSDLHIEAYGLLSSSCNTSKSIINFLDDSKDRVVMLNKLSTDFHYPPEACFLDLDTCPPKLLNGPLAKLVASLLGEEVQEKKENTKSNSGFHLFSKSAKKKEEMVSLANPFFGGLGQKQIKVLIHSIHPIHCLAGRLHRHAGRSTHRRSRKSLSTLET
ncbi:hypothetical protein Ciccas_003919 [Cichlidogyrus casuarinus]|uniref:F-BAR domain-containing protein n=1 Tax=Cichlidogyrus casuarinus TaxID=1844966 RepID=A0ABD2QD21_9PLAT